VREREIGERKEGSRDDEEGKKVEGGGGQKRLLNEKYEREREERERGTEKMAFPKAKLVPKNQNKLGIVNFLFLILHSST